MSGVADADGLKPRYYYILLALSAGDRHGQAIARDVLHSSDGRLRLWPAALYGSLDEMRERGWIEEIRGSARASDESDRKRIYRLTIPGRSRLAAETARLAQLVRLAERRMGPAPGGSS
jgi:DNA-binding PadR family transcriptional regulator